MRTVIVLVLMIVHVARAAEPTFNRDIAPIVFRHCSSCHRPGESAPFPLLTYQDVARRARQIAEVTEGRVMPPWLPDPAYGRYEGERLLSAEEIAVIGAWARSGAPEGDRADLPSAPSWRDGWKLGKPDLVVQTPVFEVAAEGRDVYRNFVVPVPITRTQYVAAVEFEPGNGQVAHHAFIRFDRTSGSRELDEKDPLPGFDGMDLPPSSQSPDGHFLSWQPGKEFSRNPEGMSWRLYPGSDLVLQMHLQPSGKKERIQSSIAFYFTEEAPKLFPQKIVLTSYNIDIPAGESRYAVTDRFVLPVDVDVLAVLPHAHYLGKDLQGYVLLPDGRTNWLIRIPDWNFNWQGDYRLEKPVFAPKGSSLVMQYLYDNSTNNPHNPHSPPQRVRYGMETKDEMAELWVQALPRKPSDLRALTAALEEKAFRFAMDFAEYRLRLNPNDAKAHVRYGQAFLARGEREKALRHFEAAVRAEPAYDEPHYFLGLIARLNNQPGKAVAHFSEAVRLNRRHGKALGNLGLLHYSARNLREAERYFLRAIQVNRNDAISHDALGVIYAQQGNLEKAEEHLLAAAQAAPNDPEIHAHLEQLRAMKRK